MAKATKTKVSEFNFYQEVYGRDIDIDLLRELEAYNFLATFKDEESEDWAIECILNNYTDFLKFKDDLFLERLIEIYDEEQLKEMIETVEAIMNDENNPNGQYLIDGDKKYNLPKENE